MYKSIVWGKRHRHSLGTERVAVMWQNTAAETPTEAFWRRLANARVKKKNRELHALRCDTNLKLGVRRWHPRHPCFPVYTLFQKNASCTGAHDEPAHCPDLI